MIPANNYEHSSISYIDLDLPPPKSETLSSSSEDRGLDFRSRPEADAEDPGTAYKKIDFVKTQAFNTTRQTVEEKYKTKQV